MSVVHFTQEHEWVRVEDDIGAIGITDYAQGQLGDVVFVELPAIGSTFSKGEQAAVVESVKAASEVYAPVSGEVVAVNQSLADEPGHVNASPMTDGWFFKIRMSDKSELRTLLDENAYQELVRGLS